MKPHLELPAAEHDGVFTGVMPATHPFSLRERRPHIGRLDYASHLAHSFYSFDYGGDEFHVDVRVDHAVSGDRLAEPEP